MQTNFWTEIKPIFALAPMEDVTDTTFRELVMRISHPDFLNVLYTEFTSIDGYLHPVGHKKVKHRLFANESEKLLLKQSGTKLVAQIWGTDPEKFYKAAKQISAEYDFDGLDINMGCPVKKIVKQGACSALIGQNQLATEIIRATREGTHLPVSVKTRTGIKEHITEAWMETLIKAEPSAIILHVRRQKDMSDNPADWGEMAKALAVRDAMQPELPVVGNGDIFSMRQAGQYLRQYRMQGVMIGRGIFMNPLFFNPTHEERTPEEKMQLLWQHTQLFVKTWKKTKNFAILKRFFKIYTTTFPGAQQLRVDLMESNSEKDVKKILAAYGFKPDEYEIDY